MRPLHATALGLALLLLPAAARASLTHRYSFNDGTANDSVGNAHGVLVNGPTVVDGVLVFSPTTNDGVNINPATGQYVDLPNNIARTRALTIETWTTWRGGRPWQRIADFGNNEWNQEIPPTDKTTVGTFGKGFIMLTPSNGLGNPIAQISVNSWGGTNDTDLAVANQPLPLDTELHIVFTHDPNSTSYLDALYVNGVRWATSVADYDSSGMSYLNYWLGRSQFHQDPFYNGTINEFRIYDHGLTPAQVVENFNRGPNVVPEPAGLGLLCAAALPLLRRRRTHRR